MQTNWINILWNSSLRSMPLFRIITFLWHLFESLLFIFYVLRAKSVEPCKIWAQYWGRMVGTNGSFGQLESLHSPPSLRSSCCAIFWTSSITMLKNLTRNPISISCKSLQYATEIYNIGCSVYSGAVHWWPVISWSITELLVVWTLSGLVLLASSG